MSRRCPEQLHLLARNPCAQFSQRDVRGDPQQVAAMRQSLQQFQQALFNDMRETFRRCEIRMTARRCAPRICRAIAQPFCRRHRKDLLQVYPEERCVAAANQEEFVKELRRLIQTSPARRCSSIEYTTLLKKSTRRRRFIRWAQLLCWYSSISEPTSRDPGLLPVAIGSLWLAGLMGALEFRSIRRIS